MALPPKSFDDWLQNPGCPNCGNLTEEVPENQQISCTCGLEYVVLERKIGTDAGKETVYWTMPVAEFFEKIDEIWEQLRE